MTCCDFYQNYSAASRPVGAGSLDIGFERVVERSHGLIYAGEQCVQDVDCAIPAPSVISRISYTRDIKH